MTSSAATRMDSEMIILSEESQTGKDKCPMISLIGRLQNMIQMNLSMKQKQIHKHKEQTQGRQVGEGGKDGEFGGQ